MAELPGPFNAAVKEFREITKQNAERTAAAEKRREIKENLADEKLISNLKTLEDKLSKAEGDDRKLLEAQIEQNREEQAERAERKTKDDELKVLSYKTLGISEKRFEKAEELRKEAEQSRSQLNELKTQLEKNGVDVKKNANFQRLEAKVRKKERAAQLRAMTPASELKERAKDSATYLKGLLGKYLGPQSRIGGLLGSIAGNLKTKVTGTISTLLGVLKTGAFIAGLAGLLLFLNSDTWKELKEKLIPRLQTAIENVKAAINRIIDDFLGENGSFLKGVKGIFREVFGIDSKIYKKLENILDSFFGEKGSLANGIDTLLMETFGVTIEDIKKTTWYKGLKLGFDAIVFVIKALGDGIYDIYKLWTFDPERGLLDKNGNRIGRLQYLYENFGNIAVVIGALAAFLAPRLLFKGLTVAAFFGITKLNSAFSGLGTRLAKMAGLIDDVDVPGVGKSITKTVATATATAAATTKFRGAEAARLGGAGQQFKLPKMSLPVGPVSNVGSMSNAARSAVGKAPGILGSIDDVAVRIFQAFPKMAVLKGIPLVGQLFTGYMFYDIMNRAMQTGDLRGAVPELANLAGNVIGGLSGFALGGMLGGLMGSPTGPGAILTGIGGGILGAFSTGTLLQAMMEYGLGLPFEAFPRFTGVNQLMNKIVYGEDNDPSGSVSSIAKAAASMTANSASPQGRSFGESIRGTGGNLPVLQDPAILQQVDAATSYMRTASGDIDDLGTAPTIVNFQGGSTTNITENKNVQYSATDVNATIYAHLQGMIP